MPHDIESLKKWFLKAKRDLPWRENPNPYAIWVSEVMLQQTQVSVVIPYFERWMQRFPTIQVLAHASQDEVIKEWEGLGYYSRARNLHEGAKFVVREFNGQLPDDEEGLSQIKGLGPYTIGAILSFAFKKRAAAVDGNVMRVLARFLKIEDDVSKPKTLKMIREQALDLIPNEKNHESWIINEALIELGAVICTKKPKCLDCPLRKNCRAFLQGCTDKLPYKSAKTKTIHLHRSVAVICYENKFLVSRVATGNIMSGLHEFPYVDSAESAQEHFEKTLGIKLKLETSLEEQTHSFTKYRVKLRPALYRSVSLVDVPGYFWHDLQGLNQLAFSSGHKRIFHNFKSLF